MLKTDTLMRGVVLLSRSKLYYKICQIFPFYSFFRNIYGFFHNARTRVWKYSYNKETLLIKISIILQR